MINREETLKILKQFKATEAEKYGILELGIFGSVARDQATENSDVMFVKMATPSLFQRVHQRRFGEFTYASVDIVVCVPQ